ncbi:MAG: hypothetical protein ACFFD4_09885 [Candidatus Odinarchaeota archaeon]
MDHLAALRPHLEMLEKVEQFEKKSEIDRFLLILALVGFIVTISGFNELVSYLFLGTDITFFMFGVTSNPQLSPESELALFLGAWLIHFLPFLVIAFFTTGSSGIINWNRAYRIIGAVIVILFFVTVGVVLILGQDNAEFIPLAWGVAFFLGFLSASVILPKQAQLKVLRGGFLVLGVVSLLLGMIASFFIETDLRMFFFGASLGTLLTLTATVARVLVRTVLVRNSDDLIPTDQ